MIGTYKGFLQNFKKNIQLFILKTRAFVRAAKKNIAFAIYATPMGTSTEIGVHEIPIQYHDFKNAFEKKNADILPEHRPYNCTIELQDGAQPPFGPIYNLSQTELTTLREYIDENLFILQCIVVVANFVKSFLFGRNRTCRF